MNITNLDLEIVTKIAKRFSLCVYPLSALTALAFVLWAFGYQEHNLWIILFASFGFLFSILIEIEFYIFNRKNQLE